MKHWSAIIRAIRHMEPPEAIAYAMEQGYSQEQATDLVMDYQKHRVKQQGERVPQAKFSESEFYKEVSRRYEGL